MLKERIENYFWDLKYDIKAIIYSIKNIFYYLPMIWRDRHWDYEFILILLKHKLKKDKKYFKKDDIVEDTDLICEQLDEVIDYIDKFLNPDSTFISERPDLAEKFADYDPLSDEINDFFKEWSKQKTDLQQKNWDKIWECISKYGQGWWN